MDNGLIPRRYAKALYKYSVEKGNSEEVYKEMKEVAESFEKNPELQKTLSNPFVSAPDKEKLLIAAAGSGVEEDFRRFVKLIIAQKREEYAHQMALAFRDMYRKEHQISRVRITTAWPMPAEELDKIRDLVTRSFPGRTLEFKHEVNPDLIGGFMVDVDDSRLDSTLSNELEQLRLKLLRSN